MTAVDAADVLRALIRGEPHPRREAFAKEMKAATVTASFGDGRGGDAAVISIALPYGETITIRVSK